jgi:hypothetical protein
VKVSDLSVDGGDGVGVEPGALGPVGGRATTGEKALRDDHMSGQGGAHGALLLQGKGRESLALLRGGDDRLYGGDGRNQLGGDGWRGRRGHDDVGPCGLSEGIVVGFEAQGNIGCAAV